MENQSSKSSFFLFSLSSLPFFTFSFFLFLLMPLLLSSPSFVLKNKLSDHMLRCNSRPSDAHFFHHNLHLDLPESHEEEKEKEKEEAVPATEEEEAASGPPQLQPHQQQPLREVPHEFLMSLIEKVERIGERLSVEQPLIERVLFHPGLEKDIKEAAER